MINYIIINGTNSNTINGLGINELPPISKPPLRVQTEEIDGRDGDISTNLGYGAYDKTITIGLFGTGYDINEVISFFNGEGTVVFSNEPNKYYKYKIINQIDYEALLKFKSATITFHCQPFKYSLTETPLEIEYEYIEQEGVESATMNNTNGGTSLKIDLKGNTSQTGTPTPDTPIPINVVSGDNTIVVGSYLPIIKDKWEQGGVSSSTGQTTVNNARLRTNEYIPITTGTYTVKLNSGFYWVNLFYYDSNYNYLYNQNGTSAFADKTTSNITIERTDVKYYKAVIKKNPEATITPNDLINATPIIELYSIPAQTYQINLGELELCKIGDYQDYFTKNSGKNLFDYKQVVKGSLNGQNGEIVRADNYVTINSLENDTITITTTAGYRGFTSPFIKIKPNTDYTFSIGSTTLSGQIVVFCYYDENKNFISSQTQYNFNNKVINQNASYVRFSYEGNVVTNGTISNIMLEQSSSATSYEPYGTGQWCKYNAIEKVVLDGTEGTWNLNETNTNTYRFTNQVLFDSSNKPLNYQASILMNNYFQEYNGNQAIGSIDSEGIAIRDNLAGLTIRANILRVIDLNGFKTWLSTHNTTVYYVLATPYLSLIEDETLISQLDNIQNAMSYDGTTNIGQVNNDKPFLLDLIAMEKGTDEVVINNIGNVYAKPTIALEGTGETDIYLNNTEILKVDLSEKNKITIDTNNMEAYDPTDNSLANRKVIGNYNSMTLPSGNTTMKITGALDKATITNYQRWL